MAKADDAVATVITVERITPRSSGKGKPYWTISADGEYYNCWDSMVKDRLAEGETYTLMVQSTESGDKVFHNIVGIAPDELQAPVNLGAIMPGATVSKPTPTPPATTAPAPQKPAPVPTSPKPTPAPAPVQSMQDPMIDVRKTALMCANALLAAEVITQKGMNEVLRKYEGYIVNGLKPEHIIDSAKDESMDTSEFVANE